VLQYLTFKLLALLAPLPSPGFAYWLCDRIGEIAYWLLPRRRKTVLRNLSIVLRDRPSSIGPLVRETFREGVKYYYDTFRIPALSDADVERLIDVEGWDNLETALAEGRGAIIFTGHFGSPALVAQILAVRGQPITTVAEPVKPEKLFNLINGARGHHGVSLLPLGPSSFKMLTEVLRRNGVVGIVGDRDLHKNGIRTELFGVETTLPAGPVMLALRSGAALIPAFTVRKGERFSAFIGEPMKLDRSGNLREDLRVNTRKLAAVLEEAVARRPEQWVVFEPLWPEDAYQPSGIAS
jgi:lauroyl/myristoyl acyltransferase